MNLTPSPFKSRREKVQQALEEKKTDLLLAFTPEHVYYLTGVAPGHAPAAALIPAQGKPIIVAPESEAPTSDEFDVRAYSDNTLERPLCVVKEMCGVVESLLNEIETPSGRIGFEYNAIPAGILEAASRFEIANLSGFLTAMRRVKDASEIEAIRMAVALIDFAQEYAMNNAAAGQSEIELFGAINSAVCVEAGGPVPFQGDFLSGERTLLMGGPATEKQFKKDEPVIVDVQLSSGQYWADTTRTFVLGESSNEFKNIFDAAEEALDKAIQAVQP